MEVKINDLLISDSCIDKNVLWKVWSIVTLNTKSITKY